MQGEYAQERNPCEVDQQTPKEALLPETVFQESEPDVPRSEKDDGCGQPDLETVQIEAIHGELPPKKDVVDERNSDRASDAVCGNDTLVNGMRREVGATHNTKTCRPASRICNEEERSTT